MGEPNAKRANVSALTPVDVNAPVVYKFLVDSNEAGHLIGSKGASVDSIQNESGAKIRIAPNGQFFPNTQRRTLMIQGPYNTVARAIDILIDRIYEERVLRNRRQSGEGGLLSLEVIVPNSAAGKVIGRGGENIAKIQSECNVQITIHKQSAGEYNQERRLTMNANATIDDLRKAMHAILDWVQRDGNSINFSMVRYGEDAENFGRGGSSGGGGGGSTSSQPYDDYSYGRPSLGGGGGGGGHGDAGWSGSDRRYPGGAPSGPPPRQSAAGRVQVQATLEAPIPDSLCWSLLRDNGRHLDILARDTGANVSVQHSGEIENGQLIRNSLAIIKGTLPTAQAALLEVERLILQNSQQ